MVARRVGSPPDVRSLSSRVAVALLVRHAAAETSVLLGIYSKRCSTAGVAAAFPMQALPLLECAVHKSSSGVETAAQVRDPPCSSLFSGVMLTTTTAAAAIIVIFIIIIIYRTSPFLPWLSLPLSYSCTLVAVSVQVHTAVSCVAVHRSPGPSPVSAVRPRAACTVAVAACECCCCCCCCCAVADHRCCQEQRVSINGAVTTAIVADGELPPNVSRRTHSCATVARGRCGEQRAPLCCAAVCLSTPFGSSSGSLVLRTRGTRMPLKAHVRMPVHCPLPTVHRHWWRAVCSVSSSQRSGRRRCRSDP